MLPRLSSSAKVALGFAAVFLLGIIAIACAFFYEFLQEYKTELNQALFYGLVFFGCLLLFTSAAIAVYAVAMLALHYQTKRLYTQEKQQTLQAITTQNLLFQVTAKQIETGRVYLSEQRTEQGVVKFKSLPKPSKQQATEPALSLPELDSPAESGNTLLNDISDCQRLLIVGGSGTGKTSLLLHIAQQRQKQGDLIILDSNGKKGKWGAYPVVGLGYDHQAIKAMRKDSCVTCY
jgi:ABC-type multidrug transport system fused ATPase/permease subunit